MRPRFLADADLNQKIVADLCRREPTMDFQTAVEAGTIALSDPDVLALAARAGRILVTHDRRTMLASFKGFVEARNSPGVIIVTQQLGIAAAIEDLLLIWAASDLEEWQNKVGYVPI